MHTGSFAERVVVHGSQVAAVPESLAFDVASLLGCGVVTGVGAALDRVDEGPGASVVVVGTGGVGLNACRVRGAGAEVVVAVDLARRSALARAFGATHAVDPRSEDTASAVRALTEGVAPTTSSSQSAARRHRAALGDPAWRDAHHPRECLPRTRPSRSSSAVDLVHDDRRIVGHKIGRIGRLARCPTARRALRGRSPEARRADHGRYALAEINEASLPPCAESLRNVIVLDAVRIVASRASGRQTSHSFACAPTRRRAGVRWRRTTPTPRSRSSIGRSRRMRSVATHSRSRPGRRDPRARVQVPRLAPLPRARGPRHSALGPAREDRGKGCASSSAERRRACAPTPRACVATSRPRTRRSGSALLRDRDGSTAFKVRIGAECGTTWTSGPAVRRSDRGAVRRRSATTRRCSSTRTAATRPGTRSRSGACSSSTGSRTSRSPAPTGASTGRAR